jgi:hypothetical protein
MIMKRFPYILLIALTLLSACSLGGVPESIAPATPTNTSPPTDTPSPTDTPTPEPTATPDVTATAAAKATETAANVLAVLDKELKTDDIAYQDGYLLWQQTAPFRISLSGPDEEIQLIEDGPTAGNFIFKSDVTWEATGLLICGVIFRSGENIDQDRQYRFSYLRLSGLPAWSIDFFDKGFHKNTPSDVRFSDALDLRNGANNTFILVAKDGEFTVYINGLREGRFFDYSEQSLEGAFGFLAGQDSGRGSCEFENSWVWSLD